MTDADTSSTTTVSTPATIDRLRLAALIARERDTFAELHPRSLAAYEAGGANLFGSVPMTWMNKAAGGFPVYLDGAKGARATDIDGQTYVDFCLGDTGAMAGHSPAATVAAVQHQLVDKGGVTVMMPTVDAAWVGAELARRFGLPLWSFSLTATDANRWAIRLVRQITGRPKILVNSWCYHGTVDETLIVVGADGAESREGNVGAPVDVRVTSRVAEYNDLEALERELAHGDVAAVLMEPALTNIGIVLPGRATSRACASSPASLRHAADQRRDAHVLGRPRRLHEGLGPRARPGHDRQVHRRRHPGGRFRRDPGAGRPDARPGRRRPHRHRWCRWHPRGQRRCRWPPCGRRWSTSSPTRRSWG